MYICLAKTNQNESGLDFCVSELGLWFIALQPEFWYRNQGTKGDRPIRECCASQSEKKERKIKSFCPMKKDCTPTQKSLVSCSLQSFQLSVTLRFADHYKNEPTIEKDLKNNIYMYLYHICVSMYNWKRICICMTESLCYTLEINTAL